VFSINALPERVSARPEGRARTGERAPRKGGGDVALHAAHEQGHVTPLARFLLQRFAAVEHRGQAPVGEPAHEREDRQRHQQLDQSETLIAIHRP
jgi:hypothetical protein